MVQQISQAKPKGPHKTVKKAYQATVEKLIAYMKGAATREEATEELHTYLATGVNPQFLEKKEIEQIVLGLKGDGFNFKAEMNALVDRAGQRRRAAERAEEVYRELVEKSKL